MSCWICGDSFPTQKKLKSHLGVVHSCLKVVCGFCTKVETTFKRISDLKVHVRQHHPKKAEDLPSEMFSENNGYWCSLSPKDYQRIVAPSPRSSDQAVHMRLVILDWTKKVQFTPSRSRQDFLKGWEEQPSFTLTQSSAVDDALDYLDIEDEPELVYVNLIPGNVFVDFRKGQDKYRLYISDDLYRDTQSVRALTRRLGNQADPALPFEGFDMASEEKDSEQGIQLAKFIGINFRLITKVTSMKVTVTLKRVTADSPLSTPIKKTRSQPKEPSPTPASFPPVQEPALAFPTSTSWSPVDLAIPLGVPAEVSSADRSAPGSSMPCLPARPTSETDTLASSDSRPATTRSEPSCRDEPLSRKYSVTSKANSQPAILPISQRARGSSATRLSQTQLPPQPSQSYRATKLLKMGGMPHWQPARRSWDMDEEVSFVEGDLTIFWPPKNWRELDPQQKLLQWEFAALQIIKARGEDYTKVTQSEVLDRFNFLALPGTAAHRAPRHSPQYMTTKSRLYTYEVLRALANGEHKDDKWLTMLEAGAMMRDCSNDPLLNQCSKIKLRLSKD